MTLAAEPRVVTVTVTVVVTATALSIAVLRRQGGVGNYRRGACARQQRQVPRHVPKHLREVGRDAAVVGMLVGDARLTVG